MTTMPLRLAYSVFRADRWTAPPRQPSAAPPPSSPPQTPDIRAPREQRMQALYEAHSSMLFGSLLRWTGWDWQATEDLVQETMLRAWRNIDSLTDDTEALRPWLVTVARRIAIDGLRARARRPRETEVDPLERLPELETPFEAVLNPHLVIDGIGQLSAEHRAALVHDY